MRDISSKTDNVGDTLPASDFNANHRLELQSIVTDAGLTLDPEGGPDTDTDMLGKAIAMYSNASHYFADTGSADTYEVDRVGNLQPLSSYIDGLIVTFKAANSNTGASTLDVDGLGVKDLVDSGGSALTSGAVVANNYVTARYNSSTDDFELISALGVGSNLTTWENVGDDFRPIVTKTGTLGDTTYLVEGLYLGDSNHIYLGDSQDLDIYFNGTESILESDGEVQLKTTSTDRIGIWTNATERWYVAGNGNLLPVTTATYQFGSTSQRVGAIYGGVTNFNANMTVAGTITTTNLYPTSAIVCEDSIPAYFGTGSDAAIYHNGSNFIIDNETGNTIIYSDTGAAVLLGTGATSHYVSTGAAFYPNTTATYDLGLSTNRWDTIYSVNALNTSDFRYKENIEPSILGLDFINALNPVSYKLIEGKDRRTRYGLIAQQVDEALSCYGLGYDDFSGIHYDKEADRWDMDYKHFFAPIIKAIQELSRRLDDQAY